MSFPADFNMIGVSGRVVRDATFTVSPMGTAFCNFSIANNTGYGKYQKANFFKVKLFGKTAEALHQYLVKGKEVIVKGEIESDDWTNAKGDTVKDFIINASFIKLGGGGQRQEETRAPNPSSSFADEDIVF